MMKLQYIFKSLNQREGLYPGRGFPQLQQVIRAQERARVRVSSLLRSRHCRL